MLMCSYIIEGGVCYLALCETTYPPHLAFTYLEAVHNEFIEQYGQRINKAQRPYHFVEFSKFIWYTPVPIVYWNILLFYWKPLFLFLFNSGHVGGS